MRYALTTAMDFHERRAHNYYLLIRARWYNNMNIFKYISVQKKKKITSNVRDYFLFVLHNNLRIYKT